MIFRVLLEVEILVEGEWAISLLAETKGITQSTLFGLNYADKWGKKMGCQWELFLQRC